MLDRLYSLLILFVFSVSSVADDKGPAWWKLSDDDTTIMITGTIHLTKPELDWLKEERKALVRGADALILELAPDQQAAAGMLAMKYGIYTGGGSLKQEIGEDLFGQLLEATGGRIPAMSMNSMKPWLVGVTVSVLSLMENGYDPESGADKTYQTVAAEAGVPIEGLEEAEMQLQLLASLAGDSAVEYITMTLEELPGVSGMVDRMTAAWVSQDIAALEEIMNDGLQAYPDLAEKLLYARNANWATQMKALLDRPGNFVVAVGAGHLAGEKSLIDLLEKQGYSVSRF